MNRGVIRSSSLGDWQWYYTELRTASDGTPTQPTLAANARRVGRYTIDATGHVVAQIQFGVGANGFSPGAGSAYVVKLPVPARRITGPRTQCRIPIGAAMTYLSFVNAPNVNVPVVPTLADPFTSLGGDEDNWAQMICGELLDWGTATFPTTPANVTVNHNLGVTFDPADLNIVFKGDAGTNVKFPFWVTSITTTQFTVNTRAIFSAATVDFDWKIQAPPQTGTYGNLVSPTAPWAWSRVSGSGPFGQFFLEIEYDAA